MDSAADSPVGLAEPPKRTAESAVECVQNARKSPGFKSPRARQELHPSAPLSHTIVVADAFLDLAREAGPSSRISRGVLEVIARLSEPGETLEEARAAVQDAAERRRSKAHCVSRVG